MKRLFLIISGILGVFTMGLSAAESYLVMEAHSNRVLLASHSEVKRPVASLTKIATAKVVLDWAKASGNNLSLQAVVPHAAVSVTGVNPLGLQPGDRISLRDAIYSLLLGSDNVAAFTLADYVGKAMLAHRRRSGDPQATFIKEMNHLAKSLGMGRTKFVSAHGLGAPGKNGYSTAADIARLCVYSMRDTGFAFYVKQRSRQISLIKVDGRSFSFKVENTNRLLGKQGITGIKTGLTAAAGQCLAVNSHRKALVKKLDANRTQIRKRDLIVVLLGSNDRFNRTSQLVNQGWSAYDHWAAQAYPQSAKKKEFLIVPKL